MISIMTSSAPEGQMHVSRRPTSAIDTASTSTQRMADLVMATQHVIGDLALPEVLSRIVAAACGLAHAPAGVLSALGDGARLKDLMTHGLELDAAESLVECIRADYAAHPAAHGPRLVGAVAQAPVWSVVMRLRGRDYAQLTLVPGPGGIGPPDEEMLDLLLRVAVVAIENALLFAESRSRQRWLQASVQIASELADPAIEQSLDLVVVRVLDCADADAAMIVLPDHARQELRSVVNRRRSGVALPPVVVPLSGSRMGTVLAEGRPMLLRETAPYSDRYDAELREDYDQVMILPLLDLRGARGALAIGRRRQAREFSAADLDMAAGFASHAALGLELAQTQRDVERSLVLDDRDRIARDLQEHVTAHLLATARELDVIAADLGDPQATGRVRDRVVEIDQTVRDIRATVFELTPSAEPGRAGPALSDRLREIAEQAREALGFRAEVEVDDLSHLVFPDLSLVDDIAAVLREALANVARHARATRVQVNVGVEASAIQVVVWDNGVGLGRPARRSGLVNLRQRAERWGGEFMVGPGGEAGRGGTVLVWRAPTGAPA